MNQKLILIGGGGHCRYCIDVIEQEGKYQICGIEDIPVGEGTFVMHNADVNALKL